jgi:DNA-binding NarL/FixJ family response regulator
MNKQKNTILIADDHPLILEGIIKQIEANNSFEIVGIANNGKKAWELFMQFKPLITILDIEMAEMDGIELTQKIKEQQPETRVILLTMHTSPWIIAKAKKANPDCILLKSMPSIEIVSSIYRVLKNGSYFPPEIDNIIKRNTHELSSIQSLSCRELEVLKLIAEGNTTQQIADKLCLSVNTIETYRKNLLLKFETPNVAGLVKKAAELGII